MPPAQNTQSNLPTGPSGMLAPNQPATTPPISPSSPAPTNSNTQGAPAKKPVAQTPANSDPKKTNPKEASATQNSLQIAEIRDGLVIMRDGSLRAVVMCQSINFDLMSTQEREAVESSYQSFLNSLYFDVQIYIRSQRVDLNNYIENLEKIQRDQEKVMLGLLMEDYIDYIKYLIENSNIMSKQFYVVVPYHPNLSVKRGGVLSLNSILGKKHTTISINSEDYKRYIDELKERTFVVLNGLNDMSVNAVTLNTQELIELYYNVYNPITSAAEHLVDINELEAPIVSKGKGDSRDVLFARKENDGPF